MKSTLNKTIPFLLIIICLIGLTSCTKSVNQSDDYTYSATFNDIPDNLNFRTNSIYMNEKTYTIATQNINDDLETKLIEIDSNKNFTELEIELVGDNYNYITKDSDNNIWLVENSTVDNSNNKYTYETIPSNR